MTWTVFSHHVGHNETEDDAPGRGGYSKVLVPLDIERATEWWADEYGKDPHRYCTYPECPMEHVWEVEAFDNPHDVRAQCGEITLDEGGIGVPKTRLYKWGELNGRLDVRVVTAREVSDEPE